MGKTVPRNRILIVEDDTGRREHFAEELQDYRIDFAESEEEARSRIETSSYDLIFLDHDLEFGNRVYIDPEEPNTGYQVAKFLAARPENRKTPVVVHSFNWFGANKILRCLPNSVYIPFGLYPIARVVRYFLEDGLDPGMENVSEILQKQQKDSDLDDVD